MASNPSHVVPSAELLHQHDQQASIDANLFCLRRCPFHAPYIAYMHVGVVHPVRAII
jgi:hypothetical protein